MEVLTEATPTRRTRRLRLLKSPSKYKQPKSFLHNKCLVEDIVSLQIRGILA